MAPQAAEKMKENKIQKIPNVSMFLLMEQPNKHTDDDKRVTIMALWPPK